MKFKSLKFIFVFASLIALLVLALPEFTIEVDGKEFRYPSVGFSKIGIPTDYRSFEKGSDLFPSTKVQVELTFGETDSLTPEAKKDILDEVYLKVLNRMRYRSRYSDIVLKPEVENDSYQLRFEIPDKYENPEAIAEWLTNRGEFMFLSTTGSTLVDLNDYDVEDTAFSNRIRIQVSNGQYFTQEFSNLVVLFNSDKQTDLDALKMAASTSGSSPVALIVDDVTWQVLSHETNDAALRLIPLLEDGYGSAETDDYIKIIQSYFQDEPIEQELAVVSVESLAPSYNPEGATFIAITFLLAVVFISLLILRKFGSAAFVAYVLTTGTIMLTLINLTKLLGVDLSLASIIGFALSYIFVTIFIIRTLYMSAKEEVHLEVKSIAAFSTVGLFMTYFIVQFQISQNITLSGLNTIFIILFALHLSMLALAYVHIRFILEMYVEDKHNLFMIIKRSK